MARGRKPYTTEQKMESFWRKTKINPDKVFNGVPCREWTKCKISLGYGISTPIYGETVASRIAWVDANGPIPKGMHVRHKACRNFSCVEVRHLAVGTPKQNSDDKYIDGTMPLGEKVWTSVLTKEQAIAIRADDRPVTLIARDYGLSEVSVGSIKAGKSWGWLDTPLVPSRPITQLERKQREGADMKLTPDAVRDIHRMRLEGQKLQEIADVMGVSRVAVGKIVRGILWHKVYQEYAHQYT